MSDSTRPPANEEISLDDGDCAVGYVRAAAMEPRRIRFDEPAFVFARGASRIRIAPASAQARSIVLESAQVGVVPRGSEANLTSESSICEFLVVRPRPPLIEATAAAYGVAVERMVAVLGDWHQIDRQRWLDEVQHRYFFERVVCSKSKNIATAFLEMELVKEIFFVVVQTDAERGCIPGFNDADDIGSRAVRHVEERLFEPLSLDEIAAKVGTSRATLVRHFRAVTGKALVEYVRERRLDEARALLSRGGAMTSVAEVALTVGYENVGAFTQAFRRRFGYRPSRRD